MTQATHAIHIMVDLETLGTKPGCRILSIGACRFLLNDREIQEVFSTSIAADTQHKLDIPEQSTLDWWAKQSDEAIAEAFHNKDAVDIKLALNYFTDWITDIKSNLGADRVYIWGKGATFDEPILAEAMRRYSITPAWTFRDSMCFRTLAEVGKLINCKEPEFIGTKHSALSDAIHQAKWADMILERCYG